MSVKEAWEDDPDVENRDPNNLNDHLKVRLHNVFLEIRKASKTSPLHCM